MNFARDGYPWMALSGSIAVAVLATAVWRRSWSMWLLGFVLLVLAACVAWMFRAPASLMHRTATRHVGGVVAPPLWLHASGIHAPRVLSGAVEWAT